MQRILITSGPTRQFLDPVRYLTNASSGKMGRALTEAAVRAGHEVVVVSGPVSVSYPEACRVINVVTTEEMLEAAAREFETCDGLIGVAAPCDYRPEVVQSSKIAKTGQPLTVHLIETPDIVATLAAKKGRRWVVGFALETDDHRYRALAKLERKCCDLIVLNTAGVIASAETQVEVLDPAGELAGKFEGGKEDVAEEIFKVIGKRLISAR